MKNKILTIPHTKGGVGKTTILVQTVIYLLSLGHKVRVADCDPNKVATVISLKRKQNKKLKHFDSTVISSVPQLVEFCSVAFDGITVIDTAGVDCPLTSKAIELCSLAVTPITPSTTEVIGFGSYQNRVKFLGVPVSKVKMLINKAHHRCKIDKDYSSFKSQLGCEFDFLDTNIIASNDYDTSVSYGMSVVEYAPASKASERIVKTTNEIIKLLEV